MKKWNLVLKRQKTMGQALAILVTAGLALTGCGSSKSYSYEATNTAAEAGHGTSCEPPPRQG